MITHWENAVKLQANLKETSSWYFQTKEGLADALLKKNYPQKAESIYQQLLKQYPENGWILFGLIRSLKAQKKYQEAQNAEQRFIKAWSHADINLPIY